MESVFANPSSTNEDEFHGARDERKHAIGFAAVGDLYSGEDGALIHPSEIVYSNLCRRRTYLQNPLPILKSEKGLDVARTSEVYISPPAPDLNSRT